MSNMSESFRIGVNREMISRVVTALVGIPILILIIGWGSAWHFSLLVFLATAGALWEYFSIVFPHQWKEQTLGIFYGIIISLGIFIPRVPGPQVWLGIVVIIIFSSYLCLGGRLAERYNHLGWTLLGILYVGYLVPHLVILYRLPHGREWIFFLLLVIMTGDTAAYFVGTLLGRRKLSPEISPGKTVEGALGAIGASLLAGLFGAKFLLPALPLSKVFPLIVAFSLLGQTGDLFESWVKRAFGVKNSGTVFPGHGGLLDRMDSLIFPAVFASYYIRMVY